MSNLVERLRRGIYCAERGRYEDDAMCDEAADRIEQLEVALREIVEDSFSVYAIEVARAALGEERT